MAFQFLANDLGQLLC
uniref:Uncharacterized protein n=1 Tax=Rhizophora mucronata TaxID=61149 RepID=A0A2P2PBQ4_RHIMU